MDQAVVNGLIAVVTILVMAGMTIWLLAVRPMYLNDALLISETGAQSYKMGFFISGFLILLFVLAFWSALAEAIWGYSVSNPSVLSAYGLLCASVLGFLGYQLGKRTRTGAFGAVLLPVLALSMLFISYFIDSESIKDADNGGTIIELLILLLLLYHYMHKRWHEFG